MATHTSCLLAANALNVESVQCQSFPRRGYETPSMQHERDFQLVYANKLIVQWAGDARKPLRSFAYDVAERAMNAAKDYGRQLDERLWTSLAAKKAWLNGEMSDSAFMEVERVASTAWQEVWQVAGAAGPESHAMYMLKVAAAYVFRISIESYPYALWVPDRWEIARLENAFAVFDPHGDSLNEEIERRLTAAFENMSHRD